MSFVIINSIKKTPNKGICLVELQSGEKYLISVDLIAKYKLPKGVPFPNDIFGSVLKDQRIIDAKNFALRLVSLKVKSTAKVIQKLKQKGFTETEVQAAINFLVEFGYIDDRIFAKNYIKFALENKKHSVARIKQDLFRKGIDKEIVAEALKEFETDEFEIENGYKIAKKKLEQLLRQNKPNPIPRLCQYLFGKGFGWETINKVCERLRLE